MSDKRFHFSISEVSLFLGKSPVTLRGWERQGLITFPREGTDRKLTCDEVIIVSKRARELGRIPLYRHDMIVAAITILKLLEYQNRRKK